MPPKIRQLKAKLQKQVLLSDQEKEAILYGVIQIYLTHLLPYQARTETTPNRIRLTMLKMLLES